MKVEEMGLKSEAELQKEIERLSLEDPIVHAIMSYYRHGDISWNRALMTMVLVFRSNNKQLTDEITKLMVNQPAPGYLIDALKDLKLPRQRRAGTGSDHR